MNARAQIPPMMSEQAIATHRDLASWHEDQGRTGSAIAIRSLAFEVERLRDAVTGSLVIVNQALADKTMAELKASALLMIAEKLAPVIDEEIEQRKHSGIGEYWAPLQALSDQLHAAIRMARP
jgi:hypothetical protein